MLTIAVDDLPSAVPALALLDLAGVVRATRQTYSVV